MTKGCWKAGLVIVLMAGALQAMDASPQLDHLLATPELWSEPADDFMLAYTALGFGYVSQQRDCARSIDKRLTFNGQRVWEALAFFTTGSVKRLELSIYNKGDAGPLDEGDFQRLCKTLSDGLSAWAGNTGNPVEETTKDRSNYVVTKHTWLKAPFAVQLSKAYVASRSSGPSGDPFAFRAEFIKVALLRVNSDAQVVKDSTTVTWIPGASMMSIKKNVKKSETGDLWIDGVPMVDQGQKGYCVAASSERLLRYYGRSVDQHQIAQLADTAAKGGTSSEGMLKALDVIGQRFTLDLKTLLKLDWTHLSHLIEDYNRAAKTAGKPSIEIGHTIDLGQVYTTMDAALLRKVRAKEVQELTQFKKDVKTYTGEGVPMLWSCMIGKYPEVPPNNQMGIGGHMRLIIGINEKTGDLIYTDSWGAGHELKRMPIGDAWAMTLDLHVLKPR